MGFNRGVLSVGAILLLLMCPQSSALEWSKVSGRQVTLFYPGQISWENLLITSSHAGAAGVRNKTSCNTCHGGDESALGSAIASTPDKAVYKQSGPPASLQTTLKIAVEDNLIHFAIDVPPGIRGQISFMLDNEHYVHSATSGCWASCHDDNTGMASSDGLELTKYLSASRTNNTRTGGGRSYKSLNELDALLHAGQYLEVLGADLSVDPVAPIHGYVLEARRMQRLQEIPAGVAAVRNEGWIVISRPLSVEATGYKAMTGGQDFSLGMALHYPQQRGRVHLVSLPVRFHLAESGEVRFITD
jgi:hypothetical protein